MNETIYMPVGEVCSSISDTYREKKNMVTLINTSDVLEGRVLNHERVPNSNLKGSSRKLFSETIFCIARSVHRTGGLPMWIFRP